jgi:hypothetical protein
LFPKSSYSVFLPDIARKTDWLINGFKVNSACVVVCDWQYMKQVKPSVA